MPKIALITGASRGLGEKFCELLAADGYELVVVGRDTERMNTLKQRLEVEWKTNVRIISQDLSEPDAAQRIADQLKGWQTELDVLINNAGFGGLGRFDSMDTATLNAMVGVNIGALTQLTRLVLPDMIRRRSGKILNVASTAAYTPGPLMAVYYATKAYVLSFSLALVEELRGTGVSSTCLCPGPTRTDFALNAGAEGSRLFSPLVPLMSAERVAQAGYRGMQRGKSVVIPGVMANVLSFAARILPPFIPARVAKRMHAQL